MDKNAIKKYAVWAREELIRRVSAKMEGYGVSKENPGDAGADAVNGRLLSKVEKTQRQRLIAQVKKDGYEQVVEKVAYTWFNRFIALRFMEVNGVLPSHVRVFTDENDAFRPQILAEVLHLELDGLDIDQVIARKQANDDDGLYKYLLITQCNALSSVLPQMFQEIEDYTELLFPDNILREGSVIHRMVTDIREEDWQDQVQIIGWLYQYYNSVPKDTVFANLKKNIKISKENIPAATQLFTPDWIVRYMVENSLGRLWVEGHPNDAMKANWKYYLEEAEQEPEVQVQLEQIRAEYRNLKPEDIKVIDPCMGSGHILVYLFDVLMQIYDSCGYSARDAVRSILENNLYGLDIDDRAAQLAYFSVMMKAASYDSRFLRRSDIPQPHVHAIFESNALGGSYKLAMGDFLLSKEHQETLNYLLDAFLDAKEYGSLLQLEDRDYAGLMEAWKYTASQTAENMNMLLWYSAVEHEIPKLIEQAIMLTQKYHVVATNPPYMGASNMNGKLVEFVKKYYPDGKSDLFAAFIERGNQLACYNGYNCMVTMQSWMFLSSFEAMRQKIFAGRIITNLMHMENMVMGIAFGTAVTVFGNMQIKGYKGTYNQIRYSDIVKDKPISFPVAGNRFAQVSADNFSKIPGSPVAYWVSEMLFKAFENKKIGEYVISDGQTKTGNNDKYLRLLWEVDKSKTGKGKRWVPHAKGGAFRRWFGNIDTLIDWSDAARTHYRSDNVARIAPEYIWFRDGICWTLISSSSQHGFRLLEDNSTFNLAAPSVFLKDANSLFYVLGYLNSKISEIIISLLNPTLNTNISDITSQPLIFPDDTIFEKVSVLVKENIALSRTDWDSVETSWDFTCHPLVRLRMAGAYAWGDSQPVMKISSAYKAWELECEGRFNQLKANEEELNRIFIDIYGLRDELTPEVEDKDVTVRKADLGRDIRSLISYAVGCMFGRYSLDGEGLAYAGGDWDEGKYKTFQPDRDNIIPICDDDYFEDDITGRFVRWVATAYGKDTLEENLNFIADALGGKGSSREVIRNYFLNDFYADHCKIYQKRPIYWLFDSGKKNGFKALVYLHRYQPDLLARMRTDYVHEQQARYRTAIDDLERRIADASTSERVKLNKQLTKLKDQDVELRDYEEEVHHLADQMIAIDLDDGVKVNYAKFQDVLAKIK